MLKLKAVLAVFVVAVFLTGHAYAETSIAVMDVEYLMQESKSAKELQKKRNNAREKLLSELSDKEKSLRDKGKEIYESRKDLSEEEFVKQSKDYEADLLEMRKLTQEHKVKFEEASAQSLQVMRDFISEVAAKISEEDGYALVLSKRYVVVGENSLDITQEALKRMDKEKRTIPFSIK